MTSRHPSNIKYFGMNNLSPVTLDCIIFGLQRFGGISNYWAKLVEFMSVDMTHAGRLVLPKYINYRDFDSNWLERMPVFREVIDERISRYLPVRGGSDNEIFHTSYYRLPHHRVSKYVVSVYDFTYERYRSGLARFVHTKQKIASIERADSVICISTSTLQDVIEYCPNVDTTKLHVIQLGVDSSIFYKDQVPFSGLNDQIVLFVGQRGGYKRFDLAIEAVRASTRLSLGVVGPTLSDIERSLLQERLGSRWYEFGPVSNADLRKLYSSAFAFIFPSDYEGFGLPILEAMACGCPVVAASLSSLPEVGSTAAYYADRQNGDSYAAALSALDSVSVRDAAIRSGIARAAEFDWSHTLNKTKAVYFGR